MKYIKNFLKDFYKDESGQGATEYILMLVVVVAIVMAFRKPIVKMIGERTEGIGSKMGDVFDAK